MHGHYWNGFQWKPTADQQNVLAESPEDAGRIAQEMQKYFTDTSFDEVKLTDLVKTVSSDALPPNKAIVTNGRERIILEFESTEDSAVPPIGDIVSPGHDFVEHGGRTKTIAEMANDIMKARQK